MGFVASLLHNYRETDFDTQSRVFFVKKESKGIEVGQVILQRDC